MHGWRDVSMFVLHTSTHTDISGYISPDAIVAAAVVVVVVVVVVVILVVVNLADTHIDVTSARPARC